MPKLNRGAILLLLLSFFSLASLAQVPNCQINFGPWTDTNASQPSFNGVTQCTYWVITYQVTGFSAISLAFESATGVQSAHGSFGNFTGTVATGINPNTSTSCATPTNCTSTFTGTPGWFRVNFPTHTGSGTIQGTLQGYKTGYFLGGNVPPTGSGCPGTVGTPCVVDGPTAAGVAPVTPPVLQAGQDGAPGLIRVFLVDSLGRTIIAGALADGVASTVPGVIQAQVGAGGVVRSLFTAIATTDVNGGQNTATAANYVYSGQGWDRQRSVSLTNFPASGTLTGVNSIGAQVTEKGSRWVVNSHPATSSQATASIAAEASVRHVVDCVTFSAAAGGAVTATNRFLSLRDGATGAGTVLIQWVGATPTAAAAGVQEISPQTYCGLNLVGTTNTAMTFEFDAGQTNVIETVSISGFNVN